jgi:hypothetical protein
MLLCHKLFGALVGNRTLCSSLPRKHFTIKLQERISQDVFWLIYKIKFLSLLLTSLFFGTPGGIRTLKNLRSKRSSCTNLHLSPGHKFWCKVQESNLVLLLFRQSLK